MALLSSVSLFIGRLERDKKEQLNSSVMSILFEIYFLRMVTIRSYANKYGLFGTFHIFLL